MDWRRYVKAVALEGQYQFQRATRIGFDARLEQEIRIQADAYLGPQRDERDEAGGSFGAVGLADPWSWRTTIGSRFSSTTYPDTRPHQHTTPDTAHHLS